MIWQLFYSHSKQLCILVLHGKHSFHKTVWIKLKLKVYIKKKFWELLKHSVKNMYLIVLDLLQHHHRQQKEVIVSPGFPFNPEDPSKPESPLSPLETETIG